MIEGVYNIAECKQHGSYIANSAGCPRCGKKPTEAAKNGGTRVLATMPSALVSKTEKAAFLSYSDYIAKYKRSSKTEYERYKYLWACVQDGTIRGLRCQPKFELFKGLRPSSNILRPRPKKIQDIGYTADFEYIYQGIRVIEDVKGTYGNSKKNRKKGIVGKPIISDSARLRHKMLQGLHPDLVFKIVTDTSEAIESTRGLEAA